MPTAEAHRRTLKDYLARRGLRWTRQRAAIAEVFLRSDGHLTSDEVHRQVARKHPQVGLATIYRTLKLFVEAGIASERTFSEGVARYEVRQPHHDHMICVECGRIVEFEDARIEALQEDVARAHGFELEWHRHELYGRCPDCRTSAEG